MENPALTTAVVKGADRWDAKPCVARTIRAASVLIPIALALITGLVVSDLFGAPDTVGDALLRIVVTGAASVVVMAAAGRVARRFVPLAALYHFTLVFPDQAPSRFGIALRSGNSKHLERRIAAARDGRVAPVADQSYFETLLELVSALNSHDRLTRGHCERTRAYTEIVIKELELPEHDADRLRWAALLHDIGKLGVDAEILNKAGRPTDEEWDQLRRHPEIGERLAQPIAAFLGPWMSAISEHHERWDGGGYPNGLAGTNIHLGGRIVAVTDAYDVMTSARSYKKPISAAAARRELVRCSGTQFDRTIVRAFLNTSLGRSRVSFAGAGALVHLREVFAVLAQAPALTAVTASASSLGASAGGAALGAAMVIGATVGAPMAAAPLVTPAAVEVDTLAVASPAKATGRAQPIAVGRLVPAGLTAVPASFELVIDNTDADVETARGSAVKPDKDRGVAVEDTDKADKANKAGAKDADKADKAAAKDADKADKAAAKDADKADNGTAKASDGTANADNDVAKADKRAAKKAAAADNDAKADKQADKGQAKADKARTRDVERTEVSRKKNAEQVQKQRHKAAKKDQAKAQKADKKDADRKADKPKKSKNG